MAKPTAIVSGAGWIGSFASKLEKALRTRGVSDEQIHELVKDIEAPDTLIEKIAEVLLTAMSKIKQVILRVSLNYAESLEKKGKSGFAYFDSDLTDKNFTKAIRPDLAFNNEEAIFVNFGEYIATDEEVVARLDKMGLRPGIPKELADVSKSHPNSEALAKCLPLAALGDVWQDPHGDRHVAYLYGAASHRGVRLYYRGSWDEGWWFLAFRK